MTVGHAIEDIFEISVWLHPIELRRLEQRSDHCPTVSTAVRPGEEVVLAPQNHGPDGSLDRIVVELDATVLDEPAQRRPARECVADRFKQIHDRIVQLAQTENIVQGRRMRVDTTVVETNIHYPTDSSLLGDGVRVLTRTMRKITALAGTAGARLRDRTRSVKRRLLKSAGQGAARPC
jgi:hypothetical protein